MKLLLRICVSATILIFYLGCNEGKNPPASSMQGMNSSLSKEVRIDKPNEKGFAIIRIREGDRYQEGIVDAQGKEVVQPRSRMLVEDISESLALVGVENKYLFVPLDQGFISSEDLDSVQGFQYAEPFRCGLALVCVDDAWFYINSEFEKAFEANFEFAESFHHDRALVKANDRYRIINTLGTTVANLDYDQVNIQSPWCWQVTKINKDTYLSGFVDLNGDLITDIVYEHVGYYDPVVKRIRVGMNDRFGFLNDRALIIIPIQFEYAEVFDQGKAKVVRDGRTFFINPDGYEVPE